MAIVLAHDGSGHASLYIADLRGDGVTRTRVNTLDPTRSHAELIFDQAPAERLGDDGQGWRQHEALFDRAAVLFAFEQVGGAQATLDMARDYAMGRYAFGRAIASFQAIKHRMADMYIAITLARSNCYYGAWALNTNAPELPVAAATARASATDAFHYCAKENIQIHGGMGFTWEFDCHPPAPPPPTPDTPAAPPAPGVANWVPLPDGRPGGVDPEQATAPNPNATIQKDKRRSMATSRSSAPFARASRSRPSDSRARC
jgi:hypothetical protein